MSEEEKPEWFAHVWRIADYYHGLRRRDVPEDVALALSIDYQRMFLSVAWAHDFVPQVGVKPND